MPMLDSLNEPAVAADILQPFSALIHKLIELYPLGHGDFFRDFS